MAEDFRKEGFDVEVEPPHVDAAPSPWELVELYLDDAAKAALGMVVKTFVDWLKRRWRSKGGARNQLVHIYGPNHEVLKTIRVGAGVRV